jgi:small neutral amino acid transporter SnatA (MarC family)
VHRLLAENRLIAALIAYVAIGLLAVLTITDNKFRAATVLILALFAVKSILRRKDLLHPDKSSDAEQGSSGN